MSHFHSETRTARKSHRCELCRRTISPGETYRYGAGMDGSTAWTWKECAHCDAIRDVARADSWSVDDEYGDDLLHEWEPTTVPHLRLKVLASRRWARSDGTLYPTPERVYSEDRYGFKWQVDAVMPS